MSEYTDTPAGAYARIDDGESIKHYRILSVNGDEATIEPLPLIPLYWKIIIGATCLVISALIFAPRLLELLR